MNNSIEKCGGCLLLIIGLNIVIRIVNFLYENGGLDGIFYVLSVIFLIFGFITWAKSYQIKQQAKKLERISKNLSDNWK